MATTPSTGQATVSLWLKPNVLTHDSRIFGQLTGGTGQAGPPRIATGGAIEVWNGATWIPVAPSGSLSAGTWSHLALAWTNNSLETYVDGTLISTATVNFDFASADFGLGARYINTFGTGFNGVFDDVSIWSHALTGAEVSVLASGAALLSPPPAPEPSSCLMLLMGAVALKGCRRSKVAHRQAT